MNKESDRYLLFDVGGETYGAPLLTIREVVEYQKPKFIPNMDSLFSGVINIRGAIVGVLDLRGKFQAQSQYTPQTALLVCDTEQGPIAAVVDQVSAVVGLDEGEIEKHAAIKVPIDQDFVVGIAKHNGKLITLINLLGVLSAEKLLRKAN